MTSVRRAVIELPVAALGPVNPLPPLAGMLDPPVELDFSAAPPDLVARTRYGQVRSMMPYLMQDDYQRDPQPATVDAAVLENSKLRATFLPGWGGRLWSLTDVDTGCELLHVPKVLQPANLGLRNAWFAGGVEWNIGTRGHCPFTCDPLHAAVVPGPGGVQVLRMWEYERLRGLPFAVDAWLPEDSAVLYVGVQVRNPYQHEVPLYWWSNTAVRETPDLRVVAPAVKAYRTGYEGRLDVVDVPVHNGLDASYPHRSEVAADYFYDLDDPAPLPWIAALDGDGYGLGIASSSPLDGRKLFCWGSSAGGRRWQEWLGGAGAQPYCEIQAGLARTQYEHVPLAAGMTVSWVEAYGPVQADPGRVHGQDWADTVAVVGDAVQRAFPLGRAMLDFREQAEREPVEWLSAGSGWGALEQHRRAAAGEPPLPDAGLPWRPETLGPEQAPWVDLVDTGALAGPPLSYVVGADWERRLASAPANWATDYHRGVIAHAAGDFDSARAHYENSLGRKQTPWALRSLALLDGSAGLADAALAAPEVWQLAVEAVAALVTAGEADRALELLDGLPAEVRARGRLRLLRVQACVAAGRLDEAGALMLEGIEVPDLREGEVSLDRLWATVHPGVPLPARYDFRMHTSA